MHFTIITPSFNQLKHLKRCVASIADQAGEGIGHSALGVGITGKVNPQNSEPNASVVGRSIEGDRGTENSANSCQFTDQVVPQAPGLTRSEAGGTTATTEGRGNPKALISIHHHIQDGASVDGSREFLAEHLANSHKPIANGYKLSFISEADGGMYDAINRGVELAVVGMRH